MSYAISNDSSNSSLMAEIFSRRTQENSALQENQEKPQNKIPDTNTHANNEARANSIEYPRPSMNALIFVEEQSATDEILEEVMETEAVQETTKQECYMPGDPRIGDDIGKMYNYREGYIEGMDWGYFLEGKETRAAYWSYIGTYGNEEGERKFMQVYGQEGMDIVNYSKDSFNKLLSDYKRAEVEFKNAMRDLGLMTDFETYNSLPENPELLAQVQERFEERMSERGIEKNEFESPNYLSFDLKTNEIFIVDRETGESKLIDTIK